MFDKTLPCSLARPLKEKSLIAKSGDLGGHSKACFTRYRITFIPDRFPESGTKNAPQCECLHEAWKTAQWHQVVPK